MEHGIRVGEQGEAEGVEGPMSSKSTDDIMSGTRSCVDASSLSSYCSWTDTVKKAMYILSRLKQDGAGLPEPKG